MPGLRLRAAGAGEREIAERLDVPLTAMAALLRVAETKLARLLAAPAEPRPGIGSLRIVVVGGSVAGLASALVLARAGHEVAVLDCDDLAPAPDVETAAATAFRTAAPQLVQPHAFHALSRQLLLQRLPDVHAALLDAGAALSPVIERMPPGMDRTPAPGDDRLTALLSRRSTVDWVFRRAAAGEPRVALHPHTRVTGLMAVPGSPPRVAGVRAGRGELPADLVVDASGRRSPLERWLAELGCRPPRTLFAECGAAYLSRHYRLRPGARRDELPAMIALPLRLFTVVMFGADRGAVTFGFAPLAADRAFAAARDAAVFTAMARAVEPAAAWLELLEPITEVAVMGGLHNTLRRLVVDGAPVVLGLHPVGDAVCATNPTFGRGVSLALQGAADLADALAAHPDDSDAQARALDEAIGEHVEPWYANQAAVDAARLAQLRHDVLGAPPSPPPPSPPPEPDGRISLPQLRAAAQLDPAVFRAFAALVGMLRRPDEVCRDPGLGARVRAVLGTAAPAPPPVGPTRERLLAALGSAG